MKPIKKLFLNLAVAVGLISVCSIGATITPAYAEEEPPVVEPSTTEVVSTTTEVVPPTDTTTEVGGEEIPPTEEPTPTPFEKQVYVRRADDTHYQELTLDTETDFTMLYVDGKVNYSVVGTYVLDGNIITLTSENEGLKENKLVLNYNGTFGVYVPSTDSEDFNVSDYISYLFSQAWFYMPIFITILISVLIPTITTIIKVTSNSKTNNRASKKMINKTNEIVNLATNMSAFMNDSIDSDLIYFKNLRATMVNQKQIKVIDQRIQILENRKEAIGSFSPIIQLKADELNKKVLKQEAKEEKKAEKVKVRVKIVDGE